MLTVALVLEFLDLKAIHDLTHQLRTPIEAFFHRNPELLSLGRQIGQTNSWVFGYFRPNYQHPFWYSEFLQKNHIPNIYFKEIWAADNQGFSFCLSEVHGLKLKHNVR